MSLGDRLSPCLSGIPEGGHRLVSARGADIIRTLPFVIYRLDYH